MKIYKNDKINQMTFLSQQKTVTSIKSFHFFTLVMKIVNVLLELIYKMCMCVYMYIHVCECECVCVSHHFGLLVKSSVGISRSVLRLMMYQAIYLRGLRINRSVSSPCQVSSCKSISIPMSLKINRKGMHYHQYTYQKRTKILKIVFSLVKKV